VEDLNWRYRFSSFQEHPEWIILKVVLRLKRATNNEIDQAIDERWAIIRATQPRQFPNVGTVFKENIDALPRLAAGMRVGGMVCSDENPAWIHNTGEGTATDAYRLICKILLRHLVRGLPMPKIEPVFLPYDPNKRISATTIINNPPFIVRFFARVFRFWWRLFNHISFRGN
jgi:hypothetical protein